MTSAALPDESKKTKARLLSELRTLRARIVNIEKGCERERQNAASLHEENTLLHNVFSVTGVSLACFDRDFNCIRANHAFAAALNNEPDYFRGKNASELFPDDSAGQILRQTIASGKPSLFPSWALPLVRPDSKESSNWMLFPIKPFSDATEKLLLCGIDILEHLQPEEGISKHMPARTPDAGASAMPAQAQLLHQRAFREQFAEILSREAQMDAAFASLSRSLIMPASLDEISSLILTYAKRLTDSETGYAGYVDVLTGYLMAPTLLDEKSSQCHAVGQNMTFREFGGLWGWPLKHRRALLSNSLSEDYRANGLPEGHLQIRRFLSVPVTLGENLLGQISVANAKRDYTPRDQAFLERIADLYAVALQRRLSEDELRAALAEYKLKAAETAALPQNAPLETPASYAREMDRPHLPPRLAIQNDEQLAGLRQTRNLAELGQMTSAIAHEIRNILHIIQMGSESMRRKVNNDPEKLKILDEMDYGISILKTLGNELLDYSKPVGLHEEKCSVKEMVGNALAAAGDKLRPLKLRLDLKNGDAQIYMDAPKVTRVLLNVISNAIEAMSDDGTLSISSRFSTRKKGRFILFSVADTGCGIPECDLEQIQQPFITTKEHGTGLGLSICRKLIEACGGKLLIRSEVGKGTTVKILLPVKSPPESG